MDKTISDKALRVTREWLKTHGYEKRDHAYFKVDDIVALVKQIDRDAIIISEGREIVKMLKGALSPGSIIDYEDVLKVDAWLEGGTE